MKFAKIVFWVAGIWGVPVLTPLFLIFDWIGRQAAKLASDACGASS